MWETDVQTVRSQYVCVSSDSDQAASQVPFKKTTQKMLKNILQKKWENVEPNKYKSQNAKEFDFLQEFQQRPVAAEPCQAPQLHNRTAVSLTFLV